MLQLQIVAMSVFISVVLLFVGLGLLIVVHAWIVGRAFRSGIGNGSMVVMVGTGTNGATTANMSEDDLEKLPSYDYVAKTDEGSSPVGCAVCLDNFKMGEKCRLLPVCKHSFHAQCVDAWLMQTLTCPMCRTSTTTDSGQEGPVTLTDASVDSRDSQPAESTTLSDIRIELGDLSTE